jgi:hypothetical protein
MARIGFSSIVIVSGFGSMLIALNAAQATLVAHYRLDETSGTSVINAIGPPHGVNSSATINQPGQIGKAYDFNGSSNFATIADPLISSGSFTLSAWIHPDSLTGANTTYGMGIMRSTHAEVLGDFFLSVDNLGKVHFANWRDPGNDVDGRHVTTSSPVVAGVWTHVAATWDGATNRIYVNGVLSSFTDTFTGAGWGTENAIGRQFTTPASYFFNGLIDDVGIWRNEALTAQQIQAITTRGLFGNDLQAVNVVPEPSMSTLVGLGILGLVRRTRRSAKATTELSRS